MTREQLNSTGKRGVIKSFEKYTQFHEMLRENYKYSRKLHGPYSKVFYNHKL